MLRPVVTGERIDGGPLERVLGIVARRYADLLAIGIHLKGERVVHSVDRGSEKVAVVPHHPVHRLQLQVGLVRVNGHISTAAGSASTASHVMVVDVVGTF